MPGSAEVTLKVNKTKFDNIIFPVELKEIMNHPYPRQENPAVVLKLDRRMYSLKELEKKVGPMADELHVKNVKVVAIEMPEEKIFNLEACLIEEMADKFFLPPIAVSTLFGNRNELTDMPLYLQTDVNVGESELGIGNRLTRPIIIFNLLEPKTCVALNSKTKDILDRIVNSENNPLLLSEEISMHVKTNMENMNIIQYLIDGMGEKKDNLSIHISLQVNNLQDIEKGLVSSSFKDSVGSIYLDKNVDEDSIREISHFINENKLKIAIILERDSYEEFDRLRNILLEEVEEEKQLFVWK